MGRLWLWLCGVREIWGPGYRRLVSLACVVECCQARRQCWHCAVCHQHRLVHFNLSAERRVLVHPQPAASAPTAARRPRVRSTRTAALVGAPRMARSRCHRALFGSARREAAVRSGLSCTACSNGGDARLLIRRLAQRRPRLPPSILSRPLPFCPLFARAACHGRRAADGTVMSNAQWPAAALAREGAQPISAFEMIELHQNLNSH